MVTKPLRQAAGCLRTVALPAALLGLWALVLPRLAGFELLLLSYEERRDLYAASGLRTCVL